MRLLIVTQTVDHTDPVLGFFTSWLVVFAKHTASIEVICLNEGSHALPANVRVHSLGKEYGTSRLMRLFRFYKLIWTIRHEYDAVFCHMNPVYVVAGAPVWKWLHKPIALWYGHRQVNRMLRLAEWSADSIFSASVYTFQLSTKKLIHIPMPVDCKMFEPPAVLSKKSNRFSLVTVGRITPIKNIDTIMRAVSTLVEKGIPIQLTIVGAPALPSDYEYESQLQSLAQELSLKENVLFVGGVPFEEVRNQYWKSDVSINACPTGGTDKVVFESVAAGTVPLVSNEGFREFLGEYASELMFKERDHVELAKRLESLYHHNNRNRIARSLSDKVCAERNLFYGH